MGLTCLLLVLVGVRVVASGMVEEVQARKELFFKPGSQIDQGLAKYAIGKGYATKEWADQLLGVFHNLSATLDASVANTRILETTGHLVDGFKIRAGLGKRLADLGAAADKDFAACLAEFDQFTKNRGAVTWNDVVTHEYKTCNPALLKYVSDVVVPGILFQIISIYDPLVPEGKTTELKPVETPSQPSGGLLGGLLGGLVGGVVGPKGLLSGVTGILTGTLNGITATLDHVVPMKQIIPKPPTSMVHVLNVFNIDE